MSEVVDLRLKPEYHNISQTLRRIADEIEAGDFGFMPSSAVLVIGSTKNGGTKGDEVLEGYTFETFGMGERSDVFTINGLLAVAMR